MSGQASYPYASGNLLEQRQTYFYSIYHGAAFLEAWRHQRADAAREMSETGPTRVGTEAVSSSARATDVLLEAIGQGLRAKSTTRETSALLDRLVQRFEVSKRLHGEYDATWRPVDSSDYRSLERYVRFAEVLNLAYQCTGALTYLNALLKIVDTLTAIRTTLNAQQRTRLREVIARERDHVEQLAASLTGKMNAA